MKTLDLAQLCNTSDRFLTSGHFWKHWQTCFHKTDIHLGQAVRPYSWDGIQCLTLGETASTNVPRNTYLHRGADFTTSCSRATSIGRPRHLHHEFDDCCHRPCVGGARPVLGCHHCRRHCHVIGDLGCKPADIHESVSAEASRVG